MPAKIDMVGKRFGRLVVLKESDHYLSGRPAWECLCDCGNTVTIRGAAIRVGNTKSCGCLHAEKFSTLRHGFAERKNKRRIYRIWSGMKRRCLNPNHPAYAWYGAKGITVCDRWMKFEHFFADMGKDYLEHAALHGEDDTSLDRINVNLGYSPENCRWATDKVQGNNSSHIVAIDFRGETKTICAWASYFGIKYTTLYQRLARSGWDVQKVFSETLSGGVCT